VNSSAEEGADVPPGVVTVTSTTADDSAGDVATHEVAELQLTDVPPVAPKLAVPGPTSNPVPVMVTTVPPASGPAFGDTPVTAGVVS
jgi:hypothetical protein